MDKVDKASEDKAAARNWTKPVLERVTIADTTQGGFLQKPATENIVYFPS